ncbi:U7 snRNA-associated Sm protein LSm10-like [Marmota monax]|uniref:U7 snRNA-associated Sm-like protein LSm10 n=1 Tax=Marmota monax TaxID=9995 RepID=A0A834PR95_MARMO|nr:U7 snRNA-associated Sm protein LSm10-like [Marmota monax]
MGSLAQHRQLGEPADLAPRCTRGAGKVRDPENRSGSVSGTTAARLRRRVGKPDAARPPGSCSLRPGCGHATRGCHGFSALRRQEATQLGADRPWPRLGKRKESRAQATSRCGRMAVSHSVKERTISENSLIILLQGLQGQVTTVDLRDESVARGRIDNVDAFMNIRLAKVTYTDRWGHQVELDDLFVTGRNVRYVHIPDNVNITATIEEQLQIIHRVRNFGSKGQGRQEFPSKKYK